MLTVIAAKCVIQIVNLRKMSCVQRGSMKSRCCSHYSSASPPSVREYVRVRATLRVAVERRGGEER